jgi:hypothetical protein
MSGQGCLVVGSLFLAAGAASQEPLYCGVARGVTQVQYTPCGKQVASLSGDEGGSIIAFEDQGRAVLPEERREEGDGGFGAHVGDRLPGKLVVGGQIADRDSVGIDPVDKLVRLDVVHRPDGARLVPTQPTDEPLVLVLPDASKAAQDVWMRVLIEQPAKIDPTLIFGPVRQAAVARKVDIGLAGGSNQPG